MILSIDEVNEFLDSVMDFFPPVLFEELNGGICLLEEAKAAFEAAKPEDENYEELKAAFEAADAALNGENGSIEVQKTKQEAYDNEGKKKEDNIKKLLAIKDGVYRKLFTLQDEALRNAGIRE